MWPDDDPEWIGMDDDPWDDPQHNPGGRCRCELCDVPARDDHWWADAEPGSAAAIQAIRAQMDSMIAERERGSRELAAIEAEAAAAAQAREDQAAIRAALQPDQANRRTRRRSL